MLPIFQTHYTSDSQIEIIFMAEIPRIMSMNLCIIESQGVSNARSLGVRWYQILQIWQWEVKKIFLGHVALLELDFRSNCDMKSSALSIMS